MTDPDPGPDQRDIPPDNGRRATIDPKTGAVIGSGAGAGGGNPGEDFDSDQGGDEAEGAPGISPDGPGA